MNLKKLFKFVKIVAPVVLTHGPDIVEAIKKARKASRNAAPPSG